MHPPAVAPRGLQFGSLCRRLAFPSQRKHNKSCAELEEEGHALRAQLQQARAEATQPETVAALQAKVAKLKGLLRLQRDIGTLAAPEAGASDPPGACPWARHQPRARRPR